MEEKAIHMRLTLKPGNPQREKFVEIKEENGVYNNTEVLRLLIRRYRLKEKKKDDR